MKRWIHILWLLAALPALADVTAWTHPTNCDAGADWSSCANAEVDDTASSFPSVDGHQNTWDTFKDSAETSSLLDELPSDLTSIDGIEVEIRGRDDFDGAGAFTQIDLSWDGGTTWTTQQRNPTGTTDYASTATDYITGGASDTWGRTWSRSEFSDANFVVRLEADTDDGFAADTDVEFIEVRVTYTPAGGGSAVPIILQQH